MYKNIINSLGQGLNLGREAKAQALAFAIQLVTGQPPIIDRQADYTEISFTPEQAEKLQDVLSAWQSQEPGEVRINIKPVVLPYVIKKYGLYLAAAVLGGVLLGRVFK
jgi:hypothetical protein